jgi:adenosylmethionine---8-amino-7-oxononanoate aminotransferase
MIMRIAPLLSSPFALTRRDEKVIWHPYTQVQTDPAATPIVRGEGALLFDANGRPYIDAISSWWTIIHGHNHPAIRERIYKQLQQLDHVMFSGFTHEPAIELAENLLALAPEPLARVFYSDNGTTAVETALKIACQYWHNRQGEQARRKIIAFRGAHHGEGFGAMAVSDRFVHPFIPFLFRVEFIHPPTRGQESRSLDELRRCSADGSAAAFIYEPSLQAVAGMVPHDPAALTELISLCREREIVTIADEVFTGFGRLGPLLVSTSLGAPPDMICLSKGLTGGVVPLGATLCAEFLFEAFRSTDRAKALLHGHAYCGNPIGCAAALANLDLLLTDNCDFQRSKIEALHRDFAAKWAGHPTLVRCDVRGTVLALEYKCSDPTYFSAMRNRLIAQSLESGVILRPLGNTLHVVPPYCISEEQLAHVYETLVATFEVTS